MKAGGISTLDHFLNCDCLLEFFNCRILLVNVYREIVKDASGILGMSVLEEM